MSHLGGGGSVWGGRWLQGDRAALARSGPLSVAPVTPLKAEDHLRSDSCRCGDAVRTTHVASSIRAIAQEPNEVENIPQEALDHLV